jgi:hypothetical protein
MLTTLADKVVRHRDCAGWHLQVFAHPEQIVALAPWLHKLPVPLVIDHLGHIDPSEGPAAEAYGVLRRLLDGGRTWVKLSGAYMRSSVHGPSYADTCPWVMPWSEMLRGWYGAATGRTTEAPGSVNDADLVDLLQAWCGSHRPCTASCRTTRASSMGSMAVENPIGCPCPANWLDPAGRDLMFHK